jgi:hypothetical protein
MGLAAEQRRGPADGWRPRGVALRGKRCEERPHDYTDGASYQFRLRPQRPTRRIYPGVVFAECNGTR